MLDAPPERVGRSEPLPWKDARTVTVYMVGGVDDPAEGTILGLTDFA